MIVSLPTFEDPFYTYSTVLEGISYTLSFRYNQREECWYLSISLPDGTSLLTGLKILVGVDLLWRHHDNRLPPGQMFATVSSNNVEHPGLSDLGQTKRVTLIYITSDEDTSA